MLCEEGVIHLLPKCEIALENFSYAAPAVLHGGGSAKDKGMMIKILDEVTCLSIQMSDGKGKHTVAGRGMKKGGGLRG